MFFGKPKTVLLRYEMPLLGSLFFKSLAPLKLKQFIESVAFILAQK